MSYEHETIIIHLAKKPIIVSWQFFCRNNMNLNDLQFILYVNILFFIKGGFNFSRGRT